MSYVFDGRKKFNNSDIIYDFCREQLQMVDEAEEYVYAFALNRRGCLKSMFEISHGSSRGSVIDSRDVFQKLLLLNADSFVMAHNHPTGDPSPSEADLITTENLRKAGEFMGIPLADHIIVGADTYYSFYKEGRVN